MLSYSNRVTTLAEYETRTRFVGIKWWVISAEGYSCQSRSLIGKHPFEKRVAVVPITALLPDFDTFSRLPDLLQNTVIRIIQNKSSLDFLLI